MDFGKIIISKRMMQMKASLSWEKPEGAETAKGNVSGNPTVLALGVLSITASIIEQVPDTTYRNFLVDQMIKELNDMKSIRGGGFVTPIHTPDDYELRPDNISEYANRLSLRIADAIGTIDPMKLPIMVHVLENYTKALREDDLFCEAAYRFFCDNCEIAEKRFQKDDPLYEALHNNPEAMANVENFVLRPEDLK